MNGQTYTAEGTAFQGRKAISRRQAFSIFAAGACMPAVAVASPVMAPDEDRNLLALAPRLEKAIELWFDLKGCSDDEVNRRSDELSAVTLEVGRCQALSLKGLAVKIRALEVWYFEPSFDPNKVWEAPGICEIADDLMFSICADAASVQGRLA